MRPGVSGWATLSLRNSAPQSTAAATRTSPCAQPSLHLSHRYGKLFPTAHHHHRPVTLSLSVFSSQLGDSGHQHRVRSCSAAGSTPMATMTRHHGTCSSPSTEQDGK